MPSQGSLGMPSKQQTALPPSCPPTLLPPVGLSQSHLEQKEVKQAHHLPEAKCQCKVSLRGKAQGRRVGNLGANSCLCHYRESLRMPVLEWGLEVSQESSFFSSRTFCPAKAILGPELCTNGWQMQSSFSSRLPHCRGTGSTEAVVCTCHSCPVQSRGLVGHSCPQLWAQDPHSALSPLFTLNVSAKKLQLFLSKHLNTLPRQAACFERHPFKLEKVATKSSVCS